MSPTNNTTHYRQPEVIQTSAFQPSAPGMFSGETMPNYPGISPEGLQPVPFQSQAITPAFGGAASAGGAAGGGFDLMGLVNRLGGIDGIIGSLGKVQKIVQSVQQFSPMIKLLAGSFLKTKNTGTDDFENDGLPYPRRRRSRSRSRRRTRNRRYSSRPINTKSAFKPNTRRSYNKRNSSAKTNPATLRSFSRKTRQNTYTPKARVSKR